MRSRRTRRDLLLVVVVLAALALGAHLGGESLSDGLAAHLHGSR